MTTFAECAKKHSTNLRAAAADISRALRDEPAAAGAAVTELSRNVRAISGAAGELEAIKAGAHAPTTHKAD